MEFKPEQLSGEQIYAGRQLFGIPARDRTSPTPPPYLSSGLPGWISFR